MNKFQGGLRLIGYKQLALQRAVAVANTPSILCYPLLQRADELSLAIVSDGELVLKGQQIATVQHPSNAPIIAASSGKIEFSSRPTLTGIAPCLIIRCDGKDTELTSSPTNNYQQLNSKQLRAKIQQAGIIGLGGAGFSTATKLTQPIETLIINGAECEPYISCDNQLIQSHAQEIIRGILILKQLLNAQRVVIALEEQMDTARVCLEKVLTNGIELYSLPTIYPTGGEKQLIQVITGLEIPSGELPADSGVLCQNIATVFAIYQAVYLGKPLTERLVTITGNGVKTPQNLWVRIGTPIADLIQQCGGYTDKVQRLIIGGSMMGIAVNDDAIPVLKTTNCLIASSQNELSHNQTAQACIRCGDCASVCPVQLLPQQLYWYGQANQTDKLQQFQLFDCIECGCCEVVCPSHIPLVQHYRNSKQQIHQQQQQQQAAELAKCRYQARLQRLARQKTEKAEAMQRKKATLAAKVAAIKAKPHSPPIIFS